MATMTATVTLIRAITEASIQRCIDRANATLDTARAQYEADCAMAKISAEDRAAGESGKLRSGGGWDRVSRSWTLLQQQVSKTKQAITSAKAAKPRKACARIAVANSYSIKDALKARGYKFEKDGVWADFLGCKVQAAWVRDVTLDGVEAEAVELEKLGATIKMDSALNQVAKNAM